MLEAGDYPIQQVPIGKRWRVAGDGTAVNLRNQSPTDTCRINHFDVCPGRAQPPDSPMLRTVWNRNAGGGPQLQYGQSPPSEIGTSRSVVIATADCPQCHAGVGEPCTGTAGQERRRAHQARWLAGGAVSRS
jgi:hypothetical protein